MRKYYGKQVIEPSLSFITDDDLFRCLAILSSSFPELQCVCISVMNERSNKNSKSEQGECSSPHHTCSIFTTEYVC